MGILNSVLSTIQDATGPKTLLRDYRNAADAFGQVTSGRFPKTKNWYLVVFDINQDAMKVIQQKLNGVTSDKIYWQPDKRLPLGIWVKSAKLPAFKFEVQKKNQYNRPSLTTTKMNYESVNFEFWDDSLSVINGFWYSYYSYMIQDPNYAPLGVSGDISPTTISQWKPSEGVVSSLYSDLDSWGTNYGLDTVNAPGSPLNRTSPFFDCIRIYQFNRVPTTPTGKNTSSKTPSLANTAYNEFILVNPVITSFDHDTVESSSSDFMSNKMSIEYETVLYNGGTLYTKQGKETNAAVAGWDAILKAKLFDTTASPLAVSKTQSILNKINTAVNVVEAGITVGEQIKNNPGGGSVLTVLDQSLASASVLEGAASLAEKSPVIAVPVPPSISNNQSVLSNFGAGGLPPTTPSK